MKRAMGKNRHGSNLQDFALLAACSTPRANKWGFPDAHGSQEAPWATPSQSDYKGAPLKTYNERGGGQERGEIGRPSSSSIGRLADNNNRCETQRPTESEREKCDVESRRTATNGFWRNADWLPCIDGKARPVEPGTFPLAHGAPARVGRLRGYGNAINAEVAKEFIKAYMA